MKRKLGYTTMPNLHYNYTTTNNKSQVKSNQNNFPPISHSVDQRARLDKNMHSHAPNRCEGSAALNWNIDIVGQQVYWRCDYKKRKKHKHKLDQIFESDKYIFFKCRCGEIIRYERPDYAGISKCGQEYVHIECDKCKKHVAVKKRCHHRLCLYCAHVRSMKWFHRLKNVHFQWPHFLTLTLESGDDLEGMVSLAISAFQKFRRHFKKRLKKGVWSLEICERSKRKQCDGKGRWYVHIHVLSDCKWIDYKEAREYWKKLTGAKVLFPVRVKEKKGENEIESRIIDPERDKEKIKKAILETCKYVTKGLMTLKPESLEKVDKVIRSRRLINTFNISRKEYLAGEGGKSLLDTKETSLPRQCKCGGRFVYKGTISKVEFMILRVFCGAVDLIEYYDTS